MAKAKSRKFKCNQCDRTFAMPAHLARHQSSAHGVPGKRKAAFTKGRKVKAGRVVAGVMMPSKLPATVSPEPLLREMRAYRAGLCMQLEQVNRQIASIDDALAAMGGTSTTPTGLKRGRGGPRSGSLKTYIERVLKTRGGPMGVKDIAQAVVKAGFQSRSKSLPANVGIALKAMKNTRKVSRGVFTLR